MNLLKESELIADHKLYDDFKVTKTMFGMWKIEFMDSRKSEYSIQTKKGQLRQFKKLDAVCSFLKKCEIKSFRVVI
jgi:hypothetical protein